MPKYKTKKTCSGAFNFLPDQVIELKETLAAELVEAGALVPVDPPKKPKPKKAAAPKKVEAKVSPKKAEPKVEESIKWD